MVGPEYEREKVIQQFKEHGLQEVIISLSEGGDEDVEKKDTRASEVNEGSTLATAGWSGGVEDCNKMDGGSGEERRS